MDEFIGTFTTNRTCLPSRAIPLVPAGWYAPKNHLLSTKQTFIQTPPQPFDPHPIKPREPSLHRTLAMDSIIPPDSAPEPRPDTQSLPGDSTTASDSMPHPQGPALTPTPERESSDTEHPVEQHARDAALSASQLAQQQGEWQTKLKAGPKGVFLFFSFYFVFRFSCAMFWRGW